jgi:hypothetical protein
MERIELTKAWLAFFSSLAWPIVALAIAFLFRAQVRELLTRVRSGEIAGAKFAFSEAAGVIREKVDELAQQPDPEQRGRIAQEIKQVAASLGGTSNEWFKYEVSFRGLPSEFEGRFIPRLAAGTPTAAVHRYTETAPGEFTGTFFIRTHLSHNTLQRLAEESGLIFLDVMNVSSAGTGRVPRDPA